MPYSTKWEEPEVTNKCAGCVPFEWQPTLKISDTIGLKDLRRAQEVLKSNNKPEIDWSSPNIILTFECVECLKEFDCNTISFKVLCDTAIAAGWKMDWHDQGYSTTCKECLNV